MSQSPPTATRVYDGSNEFAGRIAIVTGASSGIGRATAEKLAAAGASVAAVARSGGPLKALASSHPSSILAHVADISDPAAVEDLFSEVELRFGPCDLLVNNAGYIAPALLGDMSLQEWEVHFRTNVTATFLTTRRAVPGMITRGGGTIVNVSSISGIPGPQKFPGFSAYCASKAAVIALTECLSVELGPLNIRINAVSPGSVDTPMLRKANPDLRPDMTAEEVAESILFLSSARSRPMNGQNLHVFHA